MLASIEYRVSILDTREYRVSTYIWVCEYIAVSSTQDERCRFNASSVGAEDTGYVDIPSGDELALKKAVATVGPISVAIDASHMSFQFYRDGVYDEPLCSSSQLDHGVLVVGYGTSESGDDYWLVKNRLVDKAELTNLSTETIMISLTVKIIHISYT